MLGLKLLHKHCKIDGFTLKTCSRWITFYIPAEQWYSKTNT